MWSAKSWKHDHSEMVSKVLIRRLILIAIAATLIACTAADRTADGSVERAFEARQSNVQVTGTGRVDRILRDDASGVPHQRFVVRMASGQTMLIEHNTDVAPTVDELSVGDEVSFSGEYVWNEQGGLVHWTHHDPAGKHQDGWVRHNGKTYQ